jgi:hypothetical protein
MPKFINHNQVSANTPKITARIQYLLKDPLSGTVEKLIKQYFKQHPEGETVTVSVFKGIGKLNTFAKRLNRPTSLLKRDIGILISLKGEQLFGPIVFQTLRNPATMKNSSRRVPKSEKRFVDIDNYTPHILSKNTSIDGLFGCVISDTDGIDVQNEFRKFD